MNKAIYSYEDRIKNPSLPLINFEYLLSNYEMKQLVWQKYCFDSTFRIKINNKIKTDITFKLRFNECFKRYLSKYEDKLNNIGLFTKKRD